MSAPFIGQVQPFAFGLTPKGWARCDGQILPIAQNTTLFSLLGTTYGGNGTSTFGLPDLRSRVPIHVSATHPQGEAAGEESVTLLITEIPAHNHAFLGTAGNANDANPAPGAALGQVTQASGGGDPYYAPPAPLVPLTGSSISLVGGNQPHENRQPSLAINWCIALVGIFPSRN